MTTLLHGPAPTLMAGVRLRIVTRGGDTPT
jgi:hypothetical protein